MLESEAGPEAERPKIWIEPKAKANELKVAVIYYLSRNGQLEHPHLMEVPISSPRGMLCVKDVIHRLSSLRGQGMANMYSWSTKRSYKNGFVWQDLSENDFIYPSSGHEYILKGTQVIKTCLSFRSYETISTSSSSETKNSSMDAHSTTTTIKEGIKNRSISSCDYKLYNATISEELARKGANASTQTEEKGRKREQVEECEGNNAREFSESERSLPFYSSSFRVLEESLESSDYESADIRNQMVENELPSGRVKASAVLKQLISCGSSLPKHSS
ncbi:hypothetical protein Lal_00047880 [Lupinus albus]|uniref:SOSEKI DIX-like domain-containing protein n=1 Tax=Lupinus albus TaxID=3870 RepID=A0A6A4QYY2_LUPAL|nr:hypothetical protein Lalb_Chr02g0144031 [Lupinus albus]KAF1879207.1 hypothetical protein Lal_00047880 [Lupinus albus]